MSDPISTLEAAAGVAQASTSLVTSISNLLTSILAALPTMAYATTAAAAFLPPPAEDAPTWQRGVYKAVTYIAWNVRHAANAAERAKEDAKQESGQ